MPMITFIAIDWNPKLSWPKFKEEREKLVDEQQLQDISFDAYYIVC